MLLQLAGCVCSQLPDPATAWELRRHVFAHVGLALPEAPAQKIMFWVRDNHHRQFMNINEMLAIADKYSIPYS